MLALALRFSFLIYAKISCTILCVFLALDYVDIPTLIWQIPIQPLYLWLLVWFLDYSEPISLFCTISQTSPSFKDFFFNCMVLTGHTDDVLTKWSGQVLRFHWWCNLIQSMDGGQLFLYAALGVNWIHFKRLLVKTAWRYWGLD